MRNIFNETYPLLLCYACHKEILAGVRYIPFEFDYEGMAYLHSDCAPFALRRRTDGLEMGGRGASIWPFVEALKARRN